MEETCSMVMEETCSMVMEKLPQNWAKEWEATDSMELFVAEDKGRYKIFVVNKESRKLYHVVDFLDGGGDMSVWPACSYKHGKLYLVGDRDADDVHICDLTSPPPYTWKQGPPMHSTKCQHYLIPFQSESASRSLLFAISNHTDDNDPVVEASFEVLDIEAGRWEVLPLPPIFSHPGAYEVMSYTIFNNLIYFVFDEIDNQEEEEEEDDKISSKVLAFDPIQRKWLTNKGDYDDRKLVWYLNLAAHSTEDGNSRMEFIDPYMRCFLMDPAGKQYHSLPVAPCFYTFDYSSWNRNNSLRPPQALLEHVWYPLNMSYDAASHRYLTWFQLYVRPYLTPVQGLSTLMKMLAHELYRHCHSFFLPSYHITESDEFWKVCLVAFTRDLRGSCCVVASFKLVQANSNLFQAKDLKIHVQYLTNIFEEEPLSFYPKYYRVSS